MLSPWSVVESYYGVCGVSNGARGRWDRAWRPDVIAPAGGPSQISPTPSRPLQAATDAVCCFRRLSHSVERRWDVSGVGSWSAGEKRDPVCVSLQSSGEHRLDGRV